MCHIIPRLASLEFPLYLKLMKTGEKDRPQGVLRQRRKELSDALRDNLKRRKKQPSPAKKRS